MQGEDCTIVGAGPAGLFLARQLKGLDVRIIEEHREIGKPVQCTGLLSRNIDNIYKPPQECILKTVKGARLFSPSGKIIELGRSENEAYVVDRAIFDQSLAQGLEIELGKQVQDINFGSKFVVGADGPNSTVARLAGFSNLGETVTGLQYEIPAEYYDSDFVELYFGNDIAPGFFAWIVPAGERVRIGLASTKNPTEYLDKFAKSKVPGAETEIISKQAGLIPLKLRKNFTLGKIALVGDAAGQVKPTTGGGVYFGMRSAKILAEAIQKNDLELYQKNWKKEIAMDFKLSDLIRNAVRNMQDKYMEKVWDTLSEDSAKKLLLEHGDMDYPTKLLKGILKNPRMWKLAKFARHLI